MTVVTSWTVSLCDAMVRPEETPVVYVQGTVAGAEYVIVVTGMYGVGDVVAGLVAATSVLPA